MTEKSPSHRLTGASGGKGFPQGSILGPILWNILFDCVLEADMPEGVMVVAYADDIGVLVGARSRSELENTSERALSRHTRRNLKLNL